MKYERTSSSPRMAVEEFHEDVKRRGRRVVATTALQPGDAIYAAPPDLAVLYSPFASHICARCLVAEVNPNEKAVKTQQQQYLKRKGQASRAQKERSPPCNSPFRGGATAAAASTGVTSSSYGSTAAFMHNIASTTTTTTAADTAKRRYGAYCCPNCDQFVLCASCVEQLVSEVEMMAAAAAAEAAEKISTSKTCFMNVKATTAAALAARGVIDGKTILLRHPVLRAHAISCAWYISLPESIRAPGNDTDFLRFCLDYGARVLLGDTTMVAALNKLDTNAAVQSKEAHHLCEVFARDRVVATFGPRKNASTATPITTPTGAVANRIIGSSLEDAFGSLTARTALTVCGRQPPTHDTKVFPPPYPVVWTDLRDVLLRTRCNSLGFPFTAAETIGWSLQETVCMLNHSCVPNAAVVMLYDENDARRQQQADANPNDSDETRADGENKSTSYLQDRHQQQQQQPSHGLRRARRLSVSPTRGSHTRGGYTGRNLNSYRAIAVSSPSPFSTSFTESLQGWIGIQATRPIAAGEEITVSYIDLEVYGDDVQARSRHLLEQYRFLCTCELCTRQRGRKL